MAEGYPDMFILLSIYRHRVQIKYYSVRGEQLKRMLMKMHGGGWDGGGDKGKGVVKQFVNLSCS